MVCGGRSGLSGPLEDGECDVTSPPARPKLYHITHVDNLPAIVADGGLVSDRAMIARGGPARPIGLSKIKQRRVDELGVSCHRGTNVGDYVPFYFCPRSVMLYVIHRANHPELTYRGGQVPIVHLVADLHEVVAWADANGVRWAFSLSNAGAYYAQFRKAVADLDELDWTAIEATVFTSPSVKEGKQAEFLLWGRFPFHLVERIGVRSTPIQARASSAVASVSPTPAVECHSDWYF